MSRPDQASRADAGVDAGMEETGAEAAGEAPESRQEAGARDRRAVNGDQATLGWDVGGAHVKASLLVEGRIRDVAQWPAPLWQGLSHLDAAFDSADERWGAQLRTSRHGVTMTAEMIDLFPDRKAGVTALADRIGARLGADTRFFAGAGEWLQGHKVANRWRDVASANWLATAHLVGARYPEALLVDIGSTTTDLIPILHGRPRPRGRSDSNRLASGELVYLGMVRTPLCALARRMKFGTRTFNVMNELFATTADVFRLTGELAPEHDQHAPADNGDKSVDATCRRLARMIGMDAGEADPVAWQAWALQWREEMIGEIARNIDRVATEAALSTGAPLVGAGCGLALARDLAARCERPFIPFHTLANLDTARADWVSTCAPSVAVALLLERWSHTCGS